MGLLRRMINWCYEHDAGNKKNKVPKDGAKLRKAMEQCQENIRAVNDKLFYLISEKKEIEKVMADLIREYQSASDNVKSGYKIQIMALKKDLDAKKELERVFETKLQQYILTLNKLKVNEEITRLEDQINVTEDLITDNTEKLKELEKSSYYFDQLEEVEYKGRNKKDKDGTEMTEEEDDGFQDIIKEFSDSTADSENEKVVSDREKIQI